MVSLRRIDGDSDAHETRSDIHYAMIQMLTDERDTIVLSFPIFAPVVLSSSDSLRTGNTEKRRYERFKPCSQSSATGGRKRRW